MEPQAAILFQFRFETGITTAAAEPHNFLPALRKLRGPRRLRQRWPLIGRCGGVGGRPSAMIGGDASRPPHRFGRNGWLGMRAARMGRIILRYSFITFVYNSAGYLLMSSNRGTMLVNSAKSGMQLNTSSGQLIGKCDAAGSAAPAGGEPALI